MTSPWVLETLSQVSVFGETGWQIFQRLQTATADVGRWDAERTAYMASGGPAIRTPAELRDSHRHLAALVDHAVEGLTLARAPAAEITTVRGPIDERVDAERARRARERAAGGGTPATPPAS